MFAYLHVVVYYFVVVVDVIKLINKSLNIIIIRKLINIIIITLSNVQFIEIFWIFPKMSNTCNIKKCADTHTRTHTHTQDLHSG